MKTIASVVAGAMLAGSAMASDIAVYGVIDTGLSYNYTKLKAVGATFSDDTISMDSGNTAGSRWGLKGEEDLGNGLKVGFVLESGFSGDTGEQNQDRLFGRESSLSLTSSIGTFYAGRLDSMISDSGSIGWYGALVSPFGTGWGNILGHNTVMSMAGRLDNTIAYQSPTLNGFIVYAQYSMGDEEHENKSSTDRYFAIGTHYDAGALQLGFLVDMTNKKSADFTYDNRLGEVVDDAYTVNLGGSYDCGFATTYVAGQYMKDVASIGSISNLYDALYYLEDDLDQFYSDGKELKDLVDYTVTYTGFGLNLGTSYEALGGNIMLSIGYADTDMDSIGSKVASAKFYSVLAGYTYEFSKRTSAYVGAGFTRQEVKIPNSYKLNDKTIQVLTGLVHSF